MRNFITAFTRAHHLTLF